MKKKGEGLSINMIIVAALGLIVLVILAFIFRHQIIRYATGYQDTADSALDTADGKRCKTIFAGTNRKCSSTPPSAEWKNVPYPEGVTKWSDCEDAENCYEKK